jgi:hypothetical protein
MDEPRDGTGLIPAARDNAGQAGASAQYVQAARGCVRGVFFAPTDHPVLK